MENDELAFGSVEEKIRLVDVKRGSAPVIKPDKLCGTVGTTAIACTVSAITVTEAGSL